jgi:hypothetical protein
MADPWTVPSKNDAQMRCRERCTVAIGRTMHGCDMLSELPSIGIDHSISRYRRSRALYTRSYLPSQTGQNPPRARLQAGARAQNCRKHRSGEGRLMLPPWHRPGEGRLMLPPWHRPGEVRLMLPPWHRPGEVRLMLPPWHRPGEVQLMLPPWHRPGKVEQVLPQWHRPGEVEQVLPPRHRPGEVVQVLPACHGHRSSKAEMLLLPWPAWRWSVRYMGLWLFWTAAVKARRC